MVVDHVIKSIAPNFQKWPYMTMAEYKFVKELPDDYLCMICAKVLNEPHLTDCCGQHFCQACLEQWFKKQGKKICPHCRSKSFSHISYIPLKRKINALEVYCPNQAEGCTVKTEVGELNSHKNECGFAKVVCSQGCRKLILRKDMTQHCNNECSKRKIKCKYCGKEDHYEISSGNHTAICEEYPVNCPRECSAGGLRRKNLAKHTELCPLERVKCPFNEAGCDVAVLRKDLNAHMESNNQQHLMIMMTAYSKLHSEHCKLKEEFKQLSSQAITPTLVEPVRLTDTNDSFSFSITSSQGWTSPPFCVPGGYTFCIKHKEGRAASLMLLKGKGDTLKDLQYKVEIRLGMQQGTTVPLRGSFARPVHVGQLILDFNLSANAERIATSDWTKGIANINLPEKDLLNYKMTVKVIPTGIPSVLKSNTWQCHHCKIRIVGKKVARSHCPFCGISTQS